MPETVNAEQTVSADYIAKRKAYYLSLWNQSPYKKAQIQPQIQANRVPEKGALSNHPHYKKNEITRSLLPHPDKQCELVNVNEYNAQRFNNNFRDFELAKEQHDLSIKQQELEQKKKNLEQQYEMLKQQRSDLKQQNQIEEDQQTQTLQQLKIQLHDIWDKNLRNNQKIERNSLTLKSLGTIRQDIKQQQEKERQKAITTKQLEQEQIKEEQLRLRRQEEEIEKNIERQLAPGNHQKIKDLLSALDMQNKAAQEINQKSEEERQALAIKNEQALTSEWSSQFGSVPDAVANQTEEEQKVRDEQQLEAKIFQSNDPEVGRSLLSGTTSYSGNLSGLSSGQQNMKQRLEELAQQNLQNHERATHHRSGAASPAAVAASKNYVNML